MERTPGARFENIDGLLLVTPVPDGPHARVLTDVMLNAGIDGDAGTALQKVALIPISGPSAPTDRFASTRAARPPSPAPVPRSSVAPTAGRPASPSGDSLMCGAGAVFVEGGPGPSCVTRDRVLNTFKNGSRVIPTAF
jgi:hypothetical protein